MLNAAVNDSQAAYATRAEAAKLGGAGAAGTELALLASRAISAEAAAKPYQVEARILAAGRDAGRRRETPAVAGGAGAGSRRRARASGRGAVGAGGTAG